MTLWRRRLGRYGGECRAAVVLIVAFTHTGFSFIIFREEEDNNEGGATNDDSSDVTPHSAEDSEDEPEVDPGKTLGDTALQLWNTRSIKLKHDYAIAGWAMSVSHEVREQAITNMKAEDREAIERVVRRLHVVPCPNKHPTIVGKSIDEIVDLFWDEFMTFQKKTKPFDNLARWNAAHAREGKSYLWHEKYSLPYTAVFGFVACRVTSKTLGIGPCERNWAAVKNIKSGKRINLGGESVEKQALLHATSLINDARVKRKKYESIEVEGPNALFCDDDMK